MSKDELRKWAKVYRKNLSSESAVSAIRNTAEYVESQNIMFFYPLKDEVNLLELVNDNQKNFYLPKICGKELLCCPYKKGDQLCTSCFKTQEPSSKPTKKELIDLVIVPALCCDKNNFRLGYGGGFYDRFLKDYKGKTVSCIPKELLVETVFPENHDVQLNKIITF